MSASMTRQRALQRRIVFGLTEEQQRAVTAPPNRHALVLAGAGTGKTRTLIARIAWLASLGIALQHCLVATFTNRAARELKERLHALLETNNPGRLPHTGTYHSIGARFLRANAPAIAHTLEIPLTAGFSILDDRDSLRSIQHAAALQLDTGSKLRLHQRDARTLLETLNQGAHHSGDPVHILRSLRATDATVSLSQPKSSLRAELPSADILETYIEMKRKTNACDYADLIQLPVRALAARPGLAPGFSHILADEYQDTDEMQARMLQLLGQHTDGNDTRAPLYAVGDPAQLIYAWRGARIENILDLPQTIGADTYALTRNFRSPQPVLDAANAAIDRNELRSLHQLRSAVETSVPMSRCPCIALPGALEEAAFHAERIEAAIARGETPSSFAVLSRTARALALTDAALARKRIPYRVVAGRTFAQRPEIQEVSQWLRLIANPKDDNACARCLEAGSQGFGPTSTERSQLFADYQNISLLQASTTLARASQLPPRTCEHTLRIAQIHKSLTATLARIPKPSAFLVFLLSETGIGERAARGTDDPNPQIAREAQARRNRLEDLLEIAREHPDIESLHEQLSLADLRSDAPADDSVTLSTVHQAKGLEWTDVAILGLENGVLPSNPSMQSSNPRQLEEERRVFHVAITRARARLTLTWSAFRFGQPMARSIFIDEIADTIDLSGSSRHPQ